jgi:hypothetical protein
MWASLGRPGARIEKMDQFGTFGTPGACGLQDATMDPCQEDGVSFHRLSLLYHRWLAMVHGASPARERDLASAFSDPFQTPSELGKLEGRSAIPAIHLGADQSRRAPGAPE